MPEGLARPWAEQSGHLLAYQVCVESALGQAPISEMDSEMDIKRWQLLIGREQVGYGLPLRPEELGAYRQRPVYVGGREGTLAKDIEAEMRQLLERVRGYAHQNDEATLDFAAKAHLDYEQTHPFIDGNGRSGRLLAHWILVRHRVRPVLFTARDRFKTYYRCFGDPSGAAMAAYFRTHQVAPPLFDSILTLGE